MEGWRDSDLVFMLRGLFSFFTLFVRVVKGW